MLKITFILYYNKIIMNILPKQYTQFKDKQYWDHFFSSLKNTQNQFFQWYGSYSDYKSLLSSLISSDSHIFHVGCGKSIFSQDFYRDNPNLNIINCDYSEKVIEQMKKRSQQLNIKMEYTVCDLLQPLQQKYQNKFNVVLDKGTLDAMLPQDSVQNAKKIKDFYFANMQKCLIQQKLDGNSDKKKISKFIIISLLQPFVLRTIIQYFGFKQDKYSVDIYQCLIKDSKLQPFLINISLNKNQQNIIKYHPLGNQQVKKWKDRQQVLQNIHKIQQQISYGGRIKQLMAGRRTKFNIYNQNNRSMIRYVLQISDSDDKQQLGKNNCSIFIVPQGKQNSYLFNDDEGIKKLQSQIKSSRIILVKLITGNQFQNLQKVKKQLNPIIAQFIQNGFDANKVPYLTDADELGHRSYLFQNQEFIIDEVLVQQQPIRRLFLRSNPTTPQCQFKLTYLSQNANKHLKQVNSKILPSKKNMVIGIDRQQMYDSNSQFIFAGLKNLYGHPKQGWKILVLGCQFALAKFLHDQFQTSQITIVCGNWKSAKEICHKYLQMPQSERLQILSMSPELYFTQNKQQKFNIILNCFNETNNTENPARQFLSMKFQQQIASHLNHPGIYVLHYTNYQMMPNLLQYFFPVYGSQSNPVTDNILFGLRYQRKYKLDKQQNKLVVHKNMINLKARTKPEHDWETDNFNDIIMLQPKATKDNTKHIFVDEQSKFEDIYAPTQDENKDKKANKKKKKKK